MQNNPKHDYAYYDDPYDDDDYKHRKNPLAIQPSFDALKKSLIHYYNSTHKKDDILKIMWRHLKESNGLLGSIILVDKKNKLGPIIDEKSKIAIFRNNLIMQSTLLDAVTNLSATIQTRQPYPAQTSAKNVDTATNAKRNLIAAMMHCEEAIRELTNKFIHQKSPPLQEMQRLRDVTIALTHYYQNPRSQHDLKQLIEKTQQFYLKSSAFWKKLTKTLIAVVGIASIIVGALGIVPSFGTSVTLIAGGALLCAHAGVQGFKHPPKPDHHTDLALEIKNVLIHTKKLLSNKSAPEEKPVAQHNHKIRPA